MTRYDNRSDSPLHLCKLELTSQDSVGWLSTLARFHQPVWRSCVSRRYWLMRRALPTNPLVLLPFYNVVIKKLAKGFYLTSIHPAFFEHNIPFYTLTPLALTYMTSQKAALSTSLSPDKVSYFPILISHMVRRKYNRPFVLIWNLRLCRRNPIHLTGHSETF